MNREPETGDKLANYHGVTDPQIDGLKQVINLMRERNHTPITYVEVGVLFGGTFRIILEHLKLLEDLAIGIDLFEDFDLYMEPNTHGGNYCLKQDLEHELDKLKLYNFILLKGNSNDLLQNNVPHMENVVALIDGNHTYEACRDDLLALLKIMSRGFIMIHDTNLAGPQKVIKEIVPTTALMKYKKVDLSEIFEKRSNDET
jgi:hypothetical protein